MRDGELLTPPINGSNLQGLTRRSAIQLAEEMGLRVRVEPITREALYVADEYILHLTSYILHLTSTWPTSASELPSDHLCHLCHLAI